MNDCLVIKNKTFKKGDKVRCKLNGPSECLEWFTGKIYHTNPHRDVINIKRDDGIEGTGKDRTWEVTVRPENFHLIEVLIGDWDE